jgi:hypothetical protein
MLLALVGILPSANPAQAQVPPCVAGEWRANDLDRVFRDLLGETEGFQIESITGDVDLTVRGDGSYEVRYSAFTMVATIAGEPATTIIDGPVRGRMQEVAPGALVGNMTEAAVNSTVIFQGNTMTQQIPFDSDGATGDAVDYDCDRGRLTFTFGNPGTSDRIAINFSRR